jgi:hypothetical protein
MNLTLLAAGIILICIAAIHSVLGESLIFKKIRQDQLIPQISPGPLSQNNIRIIWASWHLVSILGIGFSALFLAATNPKAEFQLTSTLKIITTIPLYLSSLLVFWATHAKHPAWAGLLLVAALVSIS